ncbi:SGNH/GDSL hydrolase family protein [Patescibacteria group bacterium]|nr:MAG: SGNH/GDSL hydrolase family protein [Patescibacteria group bacterium]
MNTGTGAHYELCLYNDGSWYLYHYTALESGVLLGSWASSISPATTYHATFSLAGSALTVTIDGTQRISVTDSTISAAGKTGVKFYGTAADGSGLVIDNFVASETTANTYTFSGPILGQVNAASTNFSVTPNGIYTGTITPATSGTGSFTPASLTWSAESTTQTFTYTPSSVSGSPHTISVSSAPALTDPASIAYTVIPVQSSVAVNNAALYWSRDNVYVNGSTNALMLVMGSYLKTNFTGTTFGVNVDTSALSTAGIAAARYPVIRYAVDGGAWTTAQLNTTTSTYWSAGLSSGTHTFRLEYDSGAPYSGTTLIDKWTTPVNPVNITSFSIDSGSSASSPSTLSELLRVDGDSITEGLRSVDATDTIAGNSASAAYPHVLAGLMNVEYAQLGYGGQGWTTLGSGNVPTYPNAVDYYYNGVSRLSGGVLAQAPTYWLIVHGVNDGGAAISSAVQTRIGQARTEAGAACHIFVTVPFAGTERTNITNAYNAYVAANPTDTKVHLLDLGAGFSFTTTDGTHPDTPSHSTIATALAAAINAQLPSMTASPTSLVQGTIGNEVILTGTNTSWTAGTPGSPVFSLTGSPDARIASQRITSATAATLTIDAGSYPGTLRIVDGGNSTSTSITVTARGGVSVPASTPPQPPATGFAVAINNGDASTTSTAVTLALTGGPDTATMAISNSADFSSIGIEPYAATKLWNLCSGLTACAPGTYTVYAKFYNASGASSDAVSDGISLMVQEEVPAHATSTPPVPSGSALLDNLQRISVSIHDLIKSPDNTAVYYVGTDGKRHAFPNEQVYFTWYADFSGIRIVSTVDLATIPLGANVTYKPGARPVKFLTDPKVYAVASGGILRWITSELIAATIYGVDWNRMVDDVNDILFGNYAFGSDIISPADYDPATAAASVQYPGDGRGF